MNDNIIDMKSKEPRKFLEKFLNLLQSEVENF